MTIEYGFVGIHRTVPTTGYVIHSSTRFSHSVIELQQDFIRDLTFQMMQPSNALRPRKESQIRSCVIERHGEVTRGRLIEVHHHKP